MRSPSLKPTRLPPSFTRDSISTFTIFILPLFILALIALYNELTPSLSSTITKVESVGVGIIMANHNALNVFKKPLAVFSKEPVTGFYRDGFCRVGKEDGGNHAVAGVLKYLSPFPPLPLSLPPIIDNSDSVVQACILG